MESLPSSHCWLAVCGSSPHDLFSLLFKPCLVAQSLRHQRREASRGQTFLYAWVQYTLRFRLSSAKFLMSSCTTHSIPVDAAHCPVMACNRGTLQLPPVTPGFHLSGIKVTTKVKERVEKISSYCSVT